MSVTGRLPVPSPQRRVGALVHLLRTPLAAARLRLRLTAHDLNQPHALADLEAALMGLDTAVARLLPLAAGGIPKLERAPCDLVPIVIDVGRAMAAGGSLHTPASLAGRWDAFAVGTIVRNLLSLAARERPSPLVMTLARAAGGATLSLLASAAALPPGDARPWLIQELAHAHGGRASFSFDPNRLSAQVFLAGGERELG
jgi:hypothetical protein